MKNAYFQSKYLKEFNDEDRKAALAVGKSIDTVALKGDKFINPMAKYQKSIESIDEEDYTSRLPVIPSLDR